MRRSVKLLLRGLGIALILVVLTGLVAVFTFTTESGTRWALNRLAGMAPGELSIPEFRGSLWAGLQLKSLDYRDEKMDLQANNLDIRLSWAAAARGRVEFRKLHAEHVLMRSLTPEDPEPQAMDLTLEPLAFVLGVDDGRVGQLETEGFGDTRDFRDIRITRLSMEYDRVRLESGSVKLVELGISATLEGVKVSTSGDIPVSGSVDWVLDGDEWSGHGPLSGSLTRLEFKQELAGPYPLSLQGSIAILGQFQPEFDMNASAEHWPVGNLTLSRGTAHLVGNTGGYLADYVLDVLWPDFPPIHIEGSGQGDFDSLATLKASLETDSGSAQAAGSLTWLPEFTADLEIGVTGFDPAVLFEDFGGQLDGHAQLVVENPDHYSFTGTEINGVINQAEIKASGDLLVSPDSLLCRKCELVSGANRAEINGQTGPENIAFDLKVNAPTIGSLVPGAAGKVHANGRVEGNFDLPMFGGELQAEDLDWKGWSAKHLHITSTSSGFAEVNLTLTGEQLAFEDIALGSVEASSHGKTDSLTVEMKWSVQDLVLTVSGDLLTKDGQLSGRVRTASLSEPATGDWQLSMPVEFSYGQESLMVNPHQWRGENGALDIRRFESGAAETTLVANMSDIPLQLANTFLPSAYKLNGSAQADLDVQYKSGSWNGTVNWNQHGTVLSLIESGDRQSDVQIPQVSLQAQLADGGADMVAQITIDPGVSGQLRMQVDRLTTDANIAAELQLEGQQWGWISALVPEIDKFEGSIAVNFRADGPLQSPQLTGALELREGKLAIPALNVPINDIRLDLIGAPNGGATLSASATAGGRPVNLNGRIENILLENRTIELDLTGRAAELFNWPEYHVWASPEIRISGDASGWDLNGQLSIPMAEVNVKELPVEAVEISPDVRIIGEQAPAGMATSWSGNVRVILGENVHVVAFGLDTRLTGSLQVRMYRDRPMSADGQINLVDGFFSAYGRKLTIRDGTLNFTGPLDNPLVDVRAIREIDGLNGKIVAGIHLTGRADNLSSTIYSEPAMSEADALSYIVLGRPLSQATLAEGNELSGAAIALGLGQASRITEQIGRTLGLDQLALASDGGQGTALVAGKQINTRLYARYAYGVFSRVGTLLLRYRLSRRLTLEAAAGEAQTIELLYTVEKP